jgi:hypothetical protein
MKIKLGAIMRLVIVVALVSVGVLFTASPDLARASVKSSTTKSAPPAPTTPPVGEEASSLETVASKAGETGRKVAMSLIGLAFAVAGVVLAFRRDFREAVGVFGVGIVSVLLVTPAGLGLLVDTVNTLLGVR